VRKLGDPVQEGCLPNPRQGNRRLDGLDRAAWRALLEWASAQATISEVCAAFEYFAEGMALLARPLPSMPELITRRLTFPALAILFDRLLDRSSRGAHEQFILAALLSAQAEAEGGLRVETKSLNASDASAGTVADVQIWRRGILEEAFEVSANRWDTKVLQAAQTRERADLPRIHVIARAGITTGVDMIQVLTNNGLASDEDISVLDIRHEIRSVTARLSRPARKAALQTVYGFLKNRQPDDGLVSEYVSELHEAGLVEDDS
jgi:hypothetical protein